MQTTSYDVTYASSVPLNLPRRLIPSSSSFELQCPRYLYPPQTPGSALEASPKPQNKTFHITHVIHLRSLICLQHNFSIVRSLAPPPRMSWACAVSLASPSAGSFRFFPKRLQNLGSLRAVCFGFLGALLVLHQDLNRVGLAKCVFRFQSGFRGFGGRLLL